MATMISLVGEQPIPVLLPARARPPECTLYVCTKQTEPVARRVARLTPGAAEYCVLADAYSLPAIQQKIVEKIGQAPSVLFNITGGTKIMMLAAYAIAAGRKAPSVYYQTEGPRGRDQRSVLYQYGFDQNGVLQQEARQELVPLIDLNYYLRAHIDNYTEAGFSPTSGEALERAVHEALRSLVDEIKIGVKPQGVKEQVEIDLLIRCGNQVAALEIKTGGGDSGKKAVDQLTTTAAREYLGTYTSRFLVIGGKIDDRYKPLAQALRVRVVELADYRGGTRLSDKDARTLRQAIAEQLPCGSKQA